ncbi:MAG: alkaline phosphatase [Thermodesulfovibrionales bacterium]|nr:alkaline phosphatase [Thermodesulfovibrionales bacterium]
MLKEKQTLLRIIVTVLLVLSLSTSALAGQKNILIAIGDGMGIEQIGLLHMYNEQVLDTKANLTSIMKDAVIGIVNTGALDTPVTDSAAAATAIATGQKTNTNMVSMKPDGKSLTTIFETAKKKGYLTAIITTDTVVGGTPAPFAAKAKHRTEYDSIAEQYLNLGVDYIIGGGRMYFIPEDKEKKQAGRKDGKDLLKDAKEKGYTVVTKLEDFEKLEKADKLIALFSDKEINFANGDRDPTTQPSLSEMTEKFIGLVSKTGKPFIAMIEGARIDHANHKNDATASLEETRDFDDAVGIAYKFYQNNKDNTTLIVTSDHSNGGMVLTCYKEKDKTVCPKYDDLHNFKRVPFSFEKALKTLDSIHKGIKAGNPNMPDEEAYNKAVEQLLEEHLVGLKVTDEDIKALRTKKVPLAYQYDAQASVLGKAYFPILFTSWATTYHNATPVVSLSFGKGSERLKGFIDNTDIAKVLFSLVE